MRCWDSQSEGEKTLCWRKKHFVGEQILLNKEKDKEMMSYRKFD